MKLDKLFNPQSIAVVGASPEEGKVGHAIANNLLSLGYGGKLFFINPKHEEILGQKAFKSLAEINEPVDMAIMAIPAKFVIEEIEKNADKTKDFVVVSAGFSEIGAEGKEREEALKVLAQEKGLNVLGPNCLGFIVPSLKLNASFGSGMPVPGSVAFVSQSGALITAVVDIAEKENVHFSHIISIGNKTVIDESDTLEYLGNNPEVKVIGMYLEGIKDGQKFIKVAREISKIKPIVILKAGKSDRAQKAISSHTGALAGSYEVMRAVFQEAGIVPAETSEEFFDLVKIMSEMSEPRTGQVAILTNAGGPGVLATDNFLGRKISLAEISEKTKAKLREFLPEESSVENPIDLLGDAKEDRYKKTLSLIGKEKEIGSVLCLLTPQEQTPETKIAAKIIQFKNKTNLSIATSFMGGKHVEKAVKKLGDNALPNFRYPEQAINALDKYYRWSTNKAAGADETFPAMDDERRKKVLAIINTAKSENRKALFFSEAKTVMEMYGIKAIESWEVSNEETRSVPFPVVLKVDSDKVLHKTDKKGLVLGIENDEELDGAVQEMKMNFPGEKLIIQPMAERKTELIIGIKKDDVFGPIVVYGLGGIYTEVLKMVNFLVPPMSPEAIEKSLSESKVKFLFQETRGQAPYDGRELARILSGISLFAQEIAEVKEFDINPLLVYNNDKEAVAVDIKIII